MASIYQSIEILSKEKGIDPQIVLDAVKDAMLAAARKQFRTQEDLVADLDKESGDLQIYSLKRVVEAVEDPVKQISLSAALKLDGRPNWALKCAKEADGRLGPHLCTDCQTSDSAESARSGARQRVLGISGPARRTGELRR